MKNEKRIFHKKLTFRTTKFLDIAALLYETAALTSGYVIDDAKEFATHINRMLAMSLGVDPNAQVDPEPVYQPKEPKASTTEEKDEL